VNSRKGLSLIELLVAMAVISLLVSIMLPVLGRVRRHAADMVCRANLRQCGIRVQAVLDEHQGRFSARRSSSFCALYSVSHYYPAADQDFLCPATSVKKGSSAASRGIWGSTYGAWYCRVHPNSPAGSYGLNGWCLEAGHGPHTTPERELAGDRWQSIYQKGAENIPLFLDAISPWAFPLETDQPPDFEDFFARYMSEFCIDRHRGRVNGLFMDFSARPVGLKQLWTLKWHPKFDTANSWTAGGGALPEDWPPWMRRLRDY